MTIDYGSKRGKQGEKWKKKKVGTWQVVSKIYWCERNDKNKLHMYLSTSDIKLVSTLSFTFEGNCGTNLKVLLECMNRQYFFLHQNWKRKSKVLKSLSFSFFSSNWCMVTWSPSPLFYLIISVT